MQRFPQLGDLQRVSTEGGRIPRWAPDGSELFYQSIDGRELHAVAIRATEPTLRFDPPTVLVEGAFLPPLFGNRPYDVMPDGGFAVITRGGATTESEPGTQVILLQHWPELARVSAH